ARLIEPLGVIDEHGDRGGFGVRGEQAEGSRSDRKALLGRRRSQGQSGLQGQRLRWRDLPEETDRRANQLEQRGERYLGLGLDTASSQEPHPVGSPCCVIE